MATMRISSYLSGLEIFEVAARMESFKLAAEELFLSPSAVSQAIRKLEEDLNVELFSRQGRALALTADGRLLLNGVEKGLREIRDSIRGVTAADEHLVRIYSSPTFCSKIINPVLQNYMKATEESVSFAVISEYIPNTDRFREFDIAVLYGESFMEKKGVERLGINRLMPYCAPILANKIRSPRDVLKYPLIFNDNQEVDWADWFKANGVEDFNFRNAIHFNSGIQAIQSAKEGMGFYVECERIVQHEVEMGLLVSPFQDKAEPVLRHLYSMYVAKNKAKHKTIQELVMVIEAAYGQLAAPLE